MALRPQGAQSAEPSPPPIDTQSEEGVVLRRRRADWSGKAREGHHDEAFAPRVDWIGKAREGRDGGAFAAHRAAVDVAAATLAAYDGLTAGHSDDVVTLCGAIADHFHLPEPRRTHLLAAAQLHDIGKVALPTAILDKPAPLDRGEWEEMRRHTLSGESILASVPELAEVGRIVRHSHERFDGRGYPDGLAGEEIPLESRIVFCADAFHAIRCDRPYRTGRSAIEALEEVRAHAGTQFDPQVVDALQRTVDTVRRSAADRVAAMTDGVRSRRLVALLLALAVGGSALAAPGSPFRELLFGGEGSAKAATCEEPCVAARLGSIGHMPGVDATGRLVGGVGALAGGKAHGGGGGGTASASGRRAGRGDGADGASRQGGRRGSGGRSDPNGRRGGRATPSGPAGQGAPSRSPSAHSTPTPLGAPNQSRPLVPGRSGEAPGRSGEAPRRPASPGKPTGPAPGRSGEAPGKPTGPGKFGNGQGK